MTIKRYNEEELIELDRIEAEEWEKRTNSYNAVVRMANSFAGNCASLDVREMQIIEAKLQELTSNFYKILGY